MARAILIANSKGGCGKTTIATTLAAAFARGGLTTALADVDRQKSSLAWLKRRPDELPEIAGLDWTRKFEKPGKKVQRLIIDAPAALSVPRFRELLKMAQVIVLPVLPSAFDQAATQRFLKKIDDLKPIRSNRKPVAVVGNRVRARTRSAQELDTFLESLGHPIGTLISDRTLYTDGAYSGVSVFDKSDKRSLDAQEDWSPLITFVETN
jgi:chromosome partitioning protein